MKADWQIQYRGKELILGIAFGHATLDIVSDTFTLMQCLEMLEAPHRGLVHMRMGKFGPFTVELNLHQDDSVSIFIDGPEFDSERTQSAAVWAEKKQLCDIFCEITKKGQQDDGANRPQRG